MIQASPLLSLLVAIEMTYLILLNNYTTYYQNGQGYLKKNNRLYLYSITERFCSLLSYKYSRLFFIMSNNRLSIYFKIQYTFKPVFHNSSYTSYRFHKGMDRQDISSSLFFLQDPLQKGLHPYQFQSPWLPVLVLSSVQPEYA